MLIDKYSTEEYKGMRVILFAILGISAANPLIYLAFIDEKKYITDYETWPYILAGAICIVGAICNAKSIPERFSLKTFDIIGSGHQIFHISVLIGIAICFEAQF